jgi:hypothetical protein
MTYTAIYTERPSPKLVADILVVFAHRDEQVKDDVEGTRANLDAEGLFPHLRDFDRLAEIPEVLDLTLPLVQPEPPPPSSVVSAKEDDELPPSQVAAIHSCLRLLAGHCDGARRLDGAGFNKLDAQFGHSLANVPHLSQKQAHAGRKLATKYHRQLPADLLDLALTGGGGASSKDPIAHCGAGLAAAMGMDKSVVQIHSDGSTPAQLINAKYKNDYGDTYQNGVQPGPKKLAQFIEVLKLTGIPALYAQDGKGNDATVHVKLFDPCGSWTCYLTEFSETAPDGCRNLAFGLVAGLGMDEELGYIDLEEISNVHGRTGIGIEIDMHFTPQPLAVVRAPHNLDSAIRIPHYDHSLQVHPSQRQ